MCFQAIRRMDEILVANFMVFHDVVEAEPYDVWIADEAWEIDYFLHENPELKTAAYCWLTDFVGWLPMPDGGEHEAFLTADLQRRDDRAHRALPAHPRPRDLRRDPDDIVPDTFGPGLPAIREWTERALRLRGLRDGPTAPTWATAPSSAPSWATGRTSRSASRRSAAPAWAARSCADIVAAFDEARRLVPDLRMVAVAGPAHRPGVVPGRREGLEVPRLRPRAPPPPGRLRPRDRPGRPGDDAWSWPRRSARSSTSRSATTSSSSSTCVTGSSATAPAGASDFATSSPEALGRAIAEEIGREVDYRDVETDGAARAAALIAEVL